MLTSLTHRPRSRVGLLAGCALGALLVAAPRAASAQAFNGNPATQAGSVTYNRANPLGPGTETITINSPSAVILWNAASGVGTGSGGGINYLPSGNTATYQGAPGNGNYTVLNRVLSLTAQPLSFDGSVIGRVGAADPTPGGNILFYNPNGLIVGPNAVMSAGSLVLTTNSVAFNADGTLTDPDGYMHFAAAAGSTAGVTVLPGGQLIASGANSYVALIAPRITMGGSVTANRSISYIAGEQVDATVNAGLFDFTITTGTDVSQPITHTGSSGGAASGSSSDVKTIAFVALPKNNAITMLLSGSIGYDPATVAYNDGGSIVLASGYDDIPPSFAPGATRGSIAIGSTAFTNRVAAYASDAISIDPDGGGTTSFGGQYNEFYALNSISVDVGAGETVSADQSLSLWAGNESGGGIIDIDVEGGLIDLPNGYLALTASNGVGVVYFSNPSPSAVTGGTIDVNVQGGAIHTNGGISAYAEGYGTSLSGTGGSGTGGTVNVTVGGGGSISGSELYVVANGYGGQGYSGSGGGGSSTGGTGSGGSVSVVVQDGTLDLDSITAYAQGYAGNSNDIGGDAVGGAIGVQVGSSQTWNNVYLDASADGGEGYYGRPGNASGTPYGVSFSVSQFGNAAAPVVTINNSLQLHADATVNVGDGNGGGAVGQAGGVAVQVRNGAQLNANSIMLYAEGVTGYGYLSSDGLVSAPDLYGGTVELDAVGGTISVVARARLSANAYGAGGSSGGGTAYGGSAEVSVYDDGQLIIDGGEGYYSGTKGLLILANAYGGIGQVAGGAQGGYVNLQIGSGLVDVNGLVRLSASGLAQETIEADSYQTGNGPSVQGGGASLNIYGGALVSQELKVIADGDSRVPGYNSQDDGEDPSYYVPLDGNGGTGTGGSATVSVGNGSVDTPDLWISAQGFGGNSIATPDVEELVPYASGDGVGGYTTLSQAGGTITAGRVQLVSDGYGGSPDQAPAAEEGETFAIAGYGGGGSAYLEQTGGSLTVNGDLTITAQGFGGVGMSNNDETVDSRGGSGGDGRGGYAELSQRPFSGTAELTVNGATLVYAQGNGGSGGTSILGPRNGGDGGTGYGGEVSALFGGGGAFRFGDLFLDATGYGGSGPEQEATYPGGIDPETGEPIEIPYTYNLVGASYAGQARFELIDGGEGGYAGDEAPAFRELSNLFIRADGTSYEGPNPLISFRVQVPQQEWMPTIHGGVDVQSYAYAYSEEFTPQSFLGHIEGGTLSVGDYLYVSGYNNLDLTVGPDSLLDIGGSMQLYSSSAITTEGLIRTGGSAYASGYGGVSMSNLDSGGDTNLQAFAGQVFVGSLTSAGPVDALGTSIDITSPGALAFTAAQALGGDLDIFTELDLSYQIATATGGATLVSFSGAVTGDGLLSGGGGVLVSGLTGVTAEAITSGAETELYSDEGPVSVASLTSTGHVIASGTSVTIASPGALTFDSADAFDGDLSITAQGDLTIESGSTTRDLTLASLAGTLNSASLLSAPGNVSLISFTGLTASEVSSGGTTFLSTANGALVVDDLTSAGAVTASGQSIDIGSSGALTFAGLTVTGGPLSVVTAGDLTVPAVTGQQAVTLVSTGGAFNATGPITAGGALVLGGGSGLTAGTVVSGGTTSLTSDGGAILVTALTSPGAVTAEGGSVNLSSPGTLTFDSLVATSGAIEVLTAGSLSVGNIDGPAYVSFTSTGGSFTATGPITSGLALAISARGDLTAGTIVSGDLTLLESTAGSIRVTDLTSASPVTAYGEAVDIVSPGSLGFNGLEARSGALSVVTGGDLFATGVTGATTVALAAGNGVLSVDDLSAGGAITASGAAVFLQSNESLTFADLEATDGDLSVSADQDISLASASATGQIELFTFGGAVTATGTVAAGGDLRITAPAGIDLDTAISGNQTILYAETGPVEVASLTSPGEVGVQGTSVNIFSPGSLTLASPRATVGDLVVTTQDDLIVNGAEIIDGGEGRFDRSGTLGVAVPVPTAPAYAAGDVRLTSRNRNIFGYTVIGGRNITLRAAQDIETDSSLLATGELTATAGGRFSMLSGIGSGTTVSILSADINLGATAQLGQRGLTRNLYVHNGTTGTTYIGIDGGEGSYRLDQSEASHLFADEFISIGFTSRQQTSGQGSGGGGVALGDTVVGDLALSFGAEGNIGTGGQLEISAPQTITIRGNVAIGTASDSDTVRFDPVLIAVNTDSASIGLLGQSGAPQGRLELVGDTIAVASSGVLDQITGGAAHSALTTPLDQPSSLDPPALRAGSIAIDVADALYIQNAGTSTVTSDRQGFLAYSLDINTGSAATVIDINGQILTSGAPVTGGQVLPLVTINDAPGNVLGTFDPLSRINGCVIGSACDRGDNKPPTDDDLTYPIDPDGPIGGQLIAPLVTIVPDEPLITPPLVDEPITGVGNDDLWQTLCEPGDEQCLEDETGQ